MTLHKGSDNFRINPEEMHLAVAAFDKHLLQEKIITLCMAPPESMGDCEPHLDSVNMETGCEGGLCTVEQRRRSDRVGQ